MKRECRLAIKVDRAEKISALQGSRVARSSPNRQSNEPNRRSLCVCLCIVVIVSQIKQRSKDSCLRPPLPLPFDLESYRYLRHARWTSVHFLKTPWVD